MLSLPSSVVDVLPQEGPLADGRTLRLSDLDKPPQ